MFALTNTLAGVLVCASILWLGALAQAGRRAPLWLLVPGWTLTVLILYCLLLTKSRTAFVGLACGLGLWGLVADRIFTGSGVRRVWPIVAAAAAVLAARFVRDCRDVRRPGQAGRFRIDEITEVSVRVLVLDMADVAGFPAELARRGRARKFPAALFTVQTPSIERRDRRPAQHGARRVG